MSQLKFVNATGLVGGPNGPLMLHEGDVWDASDPLVKRHSAWFDDEPKLVHTSTAGVFSADTPDSPAVETATAAPGEKRSRPRRTKK
jgi:hypothetical protein